MKTLRAFFVDLAMVLASIAGAMVLLVVGLWLAKYPPLEVLKEWAIGAVGSRDDLLTALKNSTPLIFTGLAAGVAFRSGVFNIGAEGQSVLGALGAVTLATRVFPNLHPAAVAIPAALAAAVAGGAAWAFIAAALERYRGVPIVLATILLNFIALQLLGLLLEGPLKAHSDSGQPQSDQLAAAFQMPNVMEYSTSNLHAGFFMALAVACLAWIVQARTTFGFEILVTGLNPVAARLAGMPVAARQFGIMLVSGALAGMAGAIQLMSVEGRSLNTTPVSYGYAGIAVALLGRLHPIGIVLAALFFSFLDRGAYNLDFTDFQLSNHQIGHLPQAVADIVKGTVVLIVLVGTALIARRRGSPGELMES